jgi:GNAT superfamily N-acetyltransferase
LKTGPLEATPLQLNSHLDLEVLDLRHFSAAQLGPLLRDQAARWQRRLHWDYTRASGLLLEYIDSRVLPGFVALHSGSSPLSGHIAGYAFGVYEAAKAVIGDVYAFGEAESVTNPVCDVLLDHLLDLLQATPGVDRIESQLLMFPAGALTAPFAARGFRSCPRLFMLCELTEVAGGSRTEVDRGPQSETGREEVAISEQLKAGRLLEPWRPEFYNPAAELIHRCYVGHIDSSINDQYCSVHGAQRFLHNIIRFPGCGVFDTESSWVLRDPTTLALDAVLLCSRVRGDVGHITQLCVRPALRGQGLGQTLLRHCARTSRQRGITQLSLTVTESNTNAVRLYERNGFTTLHRFDAMVWENGE